MRTPSTDSFNSAEVSAVWERIARWWDGKIGEGNDFQKELIMPATDRLLEPRAGQTILDVACGNGNYSRRLAEKGANVVACDVSANFLQCARERTAADLKIEYLQIDATEREQLLSLGMRRFDSAVCSMAMMDMPTIVPLLGSLPKLLKPGGKFVFSLPHPCFNSNQASMTAELVNEGETARQIYSVTVRSYLKSTRAFSIGIINQPEAHYFFHRPLSEIFQEIFRAGMIVDGMDEPAFAGGASGGKNAFSWANRPEIPPAIVIRTVVL